MAREGRYHFGDRLAEIILCYRDSIKPWIIDSHEAYDMDRVLRAMEGFSGMTERDWRRSAKARKQAIEMMRVAAGEVVTKLLRTAIEDKAGNLRDRS